MMHGSGSKDPQKEGGALPRITPCFRLCLAKLRFEMDHSAAFWERAHRPGIAFGCRLRFTSAHELVRRSILRSDLGNSTRVWRIDRQYLGLYATLWQPESPSELVLAGRLSTPGSYRGGQRK